MKNRLSHEFNNKSNEHLTKEKLTIHETNPFSRKNNSKEIVNNNIRSKKQLSNNNDLFVNSNNEKFNDVINYVDKFKLEILKPTCSTKELRVIIENKFSGLDSKIKVSDAIISSQNSNIIYFKCYLSKTINFNAISNLNLSKNWSVKHLNNFFRI